MSLIIVGEKGPYRLGGLPLAPAGTEWPVCANCDGAMQFIAQLDLGERSLLVFMCQNDPGLCDEWAATGGGNRALLVARRGLVEMAAPSSGVTTLGAEFYGQLAETAPEGTRRVVLGIWGGEPDWLQGDDTPRCPGCEQEMSFVAQLEEGPDHRYSANFGGGCGYAFACDGCEQALFLWQQ
ncbi:MAG: DUF1963 domain-containing protein [Candidatus Eremiobacteraeota bacterium]|nr:DUF1963 domain-containing protein [Candidatus Eremiobacteraeota bacterium]